MYDIVIIGAGISGISAGLIFKKNNINFLIIERGKEFSERDSRNEADISNGFGGAGLFSDGKISLKPSGTNVWKLDPEKLKNAEECINKILLENGIDLTNEPNSLDLNNSEDEYYQKKYKSIKTTIMKRVKILDYFYSKLSNNVLFGRNVISITKKDSVFTIYTSNGIIDEVFSSKNVLFAGGKHGGRNINELFKIDFKKIFISYELGIRLEIDSTNFDLFDNEQLDCKLLHKIDHSTEIRTFCCSRNGIVTKSVIDNCFYFNGNSDIQTSKSNIGINIKISNDSQLIDEFEKALKSIDKPFIVDFKNFYSDKKIFIGKNIDRHLKDFLRKFFPSTLKAEGIIKGPSFERFGKYPKLSNSLQIENHNVWIAGDSTGLFRGIYPALISGVLAAKDMIKKVSKNNQITINTLKIKESSIEKIDLIYTAQSKKYFYCRDSICEFVLKNEKLPLNPFRIFDYFLSYRVDKEIIRRANNQLLNTANEIWVFGPIADGVLFEIHYAKQIGKTVKFFNISPKATDIKELSRKEITFEPEVHSKGILKKDLIDYLFEGLPIANNMQMTLGI